MTAATKFDLQALTLGEIATIEDLSGTGIGALNKETPQGKFLASLYMVAKRRSGEPTFTFNQALNVPMLEAQAFLGFDDTDDDTDDEDDDEPVTADTLRRDRAERKAEIVVNAGVSPTEYDELTVAEHAAIRAELERRAQAQHS